MRTAEMIKFASNAFLATRISFINEIGNLCKKLGIDVYEVADGMGLDPRIGRAFLNAGIGFGGSCLPKDLEALLKQYEKMGEKSAVLSAVAQVYDPKAMQKAREIFSEDIQYGDGVADTIEDCDCVLILTEWDEFKDENLYSGKIVIDGRRALHPEKARRICQSYEGVCW